MSESKHDEITVYKLGVEEDHDSLYIEAEYQLYSQQRTRTRVLKLDVADENVKRFLLYAIKLYIEKSRKKKILGRGTDILEVIVENVQLPRLRLNHRENVTYMKRMFLEFMNQVQDTDVSQAERSIFDIVQEID